MERCRAIVWAGLIVVTGRAMHEPLVAPSSRPAAGDRLEPTDRRGDRWGSAFNAVGEKSAADRHAVASVSGRSG